jgi:hypothetical protein
MVCSSANGHMMNTVGDLNSQLASSVGGVLRQVSAGYSQQGGMKRRKKRSVKRNMKRHKKSSRAKKSRKSTRRRR